MKKIIILRGNSGSEKTTVARALQKKFGYNTMMISQDEIRRNILWVKDGVDTKALPLMIELMKYGYEHCDVVILEGIMYDEWYSPLFKTANELHGMLYFAEINEFAKELHSEMEKVILMDELPENWTYPLIQPKLIEKYKQIEKQSYSQIQLVENRL